MADFAGGTRGDCGDLDGTLFRMCLFARAAPGFAFAACNWCRLAGPSSELFCIYAFSVVIVGVVVAIIVGVSYLRRRCHYGGVVTFDIVAAWLSPPTRGRAVRRSRPVAIQVCEFLGIGNCLVLPR